MGIRWSKISANIPIAHVSYHIGNPSNGALLGLICVFLHTFQLEKCRKRAQNCHFAKEVGTSGIFRCPPSVSSRAQICFACKRRAEEGRSTSYPRPSSVPCTPRHPLPKGTRVRTGLIRREASGASACPPAVTPAKAGTH